MTQPSFADNFEGENCDGYFFAENSLWPKRQVIFKNIFDFFAVFNIHQSFA
jgi:hypothetical protein